MIKKINVEMPEPIWYLNTYTVNLNEKISKDPEKTIFIGRDRELLEVMYSINRKSKNNPVLIGEAGVGKTAIVEGLVKRIISGNVPETLKSKIVYNLNLASIVHKGSDGNLIFRLNKIIEALLNDSNKIIFIDEIHTIVGAGAENNALDAGNVLKPALSRGDIQLIGATTFDEYHKFLEKDKALERRFQKIIVKEPSIQDTLKIMEGLRNSYEKFHNIKINDTAIKATVNLAERYDSEHNFPDKAIDLLDESCSRARFNNLNFIDEKSIALVVNDKTDIPITDILKSTSEKILRLEKYMNERIKGQDEAVKEISGAMRISQAGLQDPSKPMSSFIFLGTTGVGKTFAVKSLANVLFDSEKSVIRFDMTEYSSKEDVKRLIGTDNSSKGLLTEAIRRKPYSIVLFDEIEKAHSSLFDILLQVLDDGRITDGRGNTVDCKNTIIVLTTNLGTKLIKDRDDYLGKVSNEKAQVIFNKQVQTELESRFRPEFINRIDHKIVFNMLSRNAIREIAINSINELLNRAKNQGFNIIYTDKVVNFIARVGYDRDNGARPLKRVINKYIGDPLAKYILALNISNPKKIHEIKINVEGKRQNKTDIFGSEHLVFKGIIKEGG